MLDCDHSVCSLGVTQVTDSWETRQLTNYTSIDRGSGCNSLLLTSRLASLVASHVVCLLTSLLVSLVASLCLYFCFLFWRLILLLSLLWGHAGHRQLGHRVVRMWSANRMWGVARSTLTSRNQYNSPKSTHPAGPITRSLEWSPTFVPSLNVSSSSGRPPLWP